MSGVLTAGAAGAAPPKITISSQVYDDYSDATAWAQKWVTPYGPGEMAVGGTQSFANGAMTASAIPFNTSFDFSVYDHIKWLSTSAQPFPVPKTGAITFGLDITASSPGATAGRVVHGSYLQSGAPYAAATLEGQQAGATMHMVDFATGQLFDWFVSGNYAFTLYERLPSSVVNPSLLPTDPGYVGRSKMFTEIVRQVPIAPGSTHTYGITFARDGKTGAGSAVYTLDGAVISRVNRVGVPLDRQHPSVAPLGGSWPSLGPGEEVSSKMDWVTFGQGLFSLLDAFPFQHPEAPELAVSIPTTERAFGQGASATVDNATVSTVSIN